MKLLKRLNTGRPSKVAVLKYIPLIIAMLVILSAVAIGIADPTTQPPPGH